MFVSLLSDWLCEIEWNLKLFESLMRGNEMTFPGFLFDFWSLGIQIHFIIVTPVWRWHDFFHLKWKGFLKKNIWIPSESISNSQTLCNSMIFMREDKMTSSKYMKYELEVWRKVEHGLNFFLIQNHLELFGLFRIIFLQN